MIDFCVYRRGSLLVPVSASDEVEIARLPERRVFSVQTNPIVPAKLPRWYRAGVQLLVEATGQWPNRETADRQITIRAGYFESIVITIGGDTRFNPQSKAGWGAVQWREFVDRAIPVMMEYAGETKAQYRDRVDRFFGIKLREAWEE